MFSMPVHTPIEPWPKADESFREAYCRKLCCPDEVFLRRIFWRALYPHARLIAFLLGRRAEWFTADREMIRYCGRLKSLDEIDAELIEFSSQRNHGFLRHQCRLRVSGRRLKKLAAGCLAH